MVSVETHVKALFMDFPIYPAHVYALLKSLD